MLFLTANTFNLLGYSQTFLGVILTLVVLCLFLGDGKSQSDAASSPQDNSGTSNFIRNLLSILNVRFTFRLRRYEKEIKDEISKFQESKDYREARKLLDKTSPKSRALNKLKYNTTTNLFNYQTQIAETYPPIDHISKYREQVLAPLYVLIYGLLIFLLDEIGHFIPVTFKSFLFSINILTVLSSAYWLVIWITFLIHSSNQHEFSERQNKWNRIEDKIRVPLAAILTMLLMLGLLVAALLLIPWREASIEYGQTLLGIIVIVALPVIYGIIRLRNCNIRGYYSYLHVMGHLLVFSIYAVSVTLLFHFVDSTHLPQISVFDSIEITRIGIIVFALLNGLIAPFIFPYWRALIIFRDKKREIKSSRKSIFSEIKAFPQKFSEACKDELLEVSNQKESGCPQD